jgi:hypothetical protein
MRTDGSEPNGAKEILMSMRKNNMSEPFKKQVGGDHYKGFAIEPIRFCQKNGLGAAESSIVKYACRWKRKHTGNLDDLRKIIHYAELLIAMELESPDHQEEDEFRSERKFNTFSDEADIVRVENV